MTDLVPLHEHDHPHLRRVCSFETTNGEHIQVDHIFDNDVCAEHGVDNDCKLMLR